MDKILYLIKIIEQIFSKLENKSIHTITRYPKYPQIEMAEAIVQNKLDIIIAKQKVLENLVLEIETKVDKIGIEELEKAVQHIAENLPKLGPVIRRQNAFNKIVKFSINQIGVEQALLNEITIPKEEE